MNDHYNHERKQLVLHNELIETSNLSGPFFFFLFGTKYYLIQAPLSHQRMTLLVSRSERERELNFIFSLSLPHFHLNFPSTFSFPLSFFLLQLSLSFQKCSLASLHLSPRFEWIQKWWYKSNEEEVVIEIKRGEREKFCGRKERKRFLSLKKKGSKKATGWEINEGNRFSRLIPFFCPLPFSIPSFFFQQLWFQDSFFLPFPLLSLTFPLFLSFFSLLSR